ncbi:MAG: LysM peptidoglycan-binding domain-containing protein [Phycisphaeraceae bacterium]|nr:LysM peptidoglycan-binding domain-containing protein [Phycisphaeraceae bacterium]
MTREHKLALIVGFAFVLVVGVLLSDHFSSARKSQPRGDLVNLGPREAGGHTLSLHQPSDSRFGEQVSFNSVRDRAFALPETTPRSTEPTVGPLRAADSQRIADPLGLGEAFAGSGQGVPPGLEGYFEQVSDARSPHVISMAGNGSSRSEFNGVAARTETVPIGSVPGQTPGPDVVRAGLPNAGTSMPARPQSRTYTIRDGDSLYAIARRELGDGNKWTTLRDLNRSLVGEEGERLKAGMKITLPSAVLPDARDGSSRASVGSASAPAGAARPATVAANTGGTYTIQKGDVLSVIAQKTLGSARRWPEIVAANKSVIDDPDTLPVGTVIRIPVR